LPQQGTAHAPRLLLAAAQAPEQRLARRLLDGVPRVLGSILRGGLGTPEEPAQALGGLPAATQRKFISACACAQNVLVVRAARSLQDQGRLLHHRALDR